MGFRNYIGVMPKKEYNKIKSLTYEQLVNFYKEEIEEDESWHKSVYEFGTELYEFGKDVDFNPPKKSFKPFFKNKELHKEYNTDYDFFIATPEFLEYIIENYSNRVRKYYNEMIQPFNHTDEEKIFMEKPVTFLESAKRKFGYEKDTYTFDFSLITEKEQTALYEIISHVKSFRSEWVHLCPYNLKKGDEVTKSWKYEYAIFELVRIYKTFDWKRNILIYYGF